MFLSFTNREARISFFGALVLAASLVAPSNAAAQSPVSANQRGRWCASPSCPKAAQAGTNEYDLIILDILLPRINGLDLCSRLRADGLSVPMLMLTARGGPDQRVEGLDAGADDYLPKPYHFPELLARVRALLRRGPALTPSLLSFHDLTVDTRARRVERAGRHIPLTTKEYALLEILLRRHGEVVGRADIAEHVWDDSFDPMSNLIEVYIQRLRRKIDNGQPVKLIHTQRGAGYSLAIADEAGH